MAACRPPAKPALEQAQAAPAISANTFVQIPGRPRIVTSDFHPDTRQLLTGDIDATVGVWDIDSGRRRRLLSGHTKSVRKVLWSPDATHALSCSDDHTVRFWDVHEERCAAVMEHHAAPVNTVVWDHERRQVISGGDDHTLRLWDPKTGRASRPIDAHPGRITSAAWTDRLVLTGCDDKTVRRHDLDLRRRTRVFEGHTDAVSDVAFHPSAAGLSRVLAGEKWQPTDSTVGAWATQWKLPVQSGDHVEREIWL